MRRFCLLVICALLLTGSIPAACGEGLPDEHRVKLTYQDTTQANGSIVRLWHADTVLDSVDQELEDIAAAMVEKYASTLQKPRNKTTRNSRLDVTIRYSRTGTKWLSFLVQGRVVYHQKLLAQSVESRTYDMETGKRITLEDIFPADSQGWSVLQSQVKAQAGAYFTREDAPSDDALSALAALDRVKETPFTLHGMSLVLHYPADALHQDRHSLMEVTVMYPDIRPYMGETAQAQTDNLTLYKTVAITFDDGPRRVNSSLTLTKLMQSGIRATFFLVGNRISGNADVVVREHDEGHAIGGHNWTHANVTKVSGKTIQQMRPRLDRALENAIGIPTRYNRVPYGLYVQMIRAKSGWPLIQWSLDTYDWHGIPAKRIAGTVTNQISDGDIILCHDVKDNTHDAVPLIVNALEERGYIFLTVDELFAKDGVALEPDRVYFHCVDGDTSLKKR